MQNNNVLIDSKRKQLFYLFHSISFNILNNKTPENRVLKSRIPQQIAELAIKKVFCCINLNELAITDHLFRHTQTDNTHKLQSSTL